MIYKNFKQPRDIWTSCYVEVVLVTRIFILDGFCRPSRGKIDFMDNFIQFILGCDAVATLSSEIRMIGTIVDG